MLVNPFRYQAALTTIPGSRMLSETMGLIGANFEDSKYPQRLWTIVNLFAPIQNRHLGGIRAKLQDQKGFVTFCNQRDQELLLGLAKPGNLCAWTDAEYPELDSKDFFGMCTDEEDLEDDLFERELHLRSLMASSPEYPDVIPYGYELVRLVHVSRSRDVEERYTMLYDCDPQTGYGPDPRFDTLGRRWVRVERNNLRWEAA